jgi:hypothetical protein
VTCRNSHGQTSDGLIGANELIDLHDQLDNGVGFNDCCNKLLKPLE